ncbi:MAG: polyprenyl synthetase family protein [Vicinamibacterales bacterium]
MIDFDTYIDARRARVQRALATSLPCVPSVPAVLHTALAYSLDAGGKRLRPVLSLLAAEAVSMDDRVVALAEPAACAIELIHTYSLIHDDLPAMDNDTLRRGRPTSHVVFGEGLAILAGDGLLTEAFALLASRPPGEEPELQRRKLAALSRIAVAAGATGMVGGQAIDLAAAGQVCIEGAATTFTLDASGLVDMHARKTGALIRAAAVSGAVMAGALEGQIAAIDRYAAHLGLAFQIVDDILDVEGESSALGKTAGKDAAAGKPTFPSLYGVDGARTRAAAASEAAVEALSAAAFARPAPLNALAAWVTSRTH